MSVSRRQALSGLAAFVTVPVVKPSSPWQSQTNIVTPDLDAIATSLLEVKQRIERVAIQIVFRVLHNSHSATRRVWQGDSVSTIVLDMTGRYTLVDRVGSQRFVKTCADGTYSFAVSPRDRPDALVERVVRTALPRDEPSSLLSRLLPHLPGVLRTSGTVSATGNSIYSVRGTDSSGRALSAVVDTQQMIVTSVSSESIQDTYADHAQVASRAWWPMRVGHVERDPDGLPSTVWEGRVTRISVNEAVSDRWFDPRKDAYL